MVRKALVSITFFAIIMALFSASVVIDNINAAEPGEFTDHPATETFKSTPAEIDISSNSNFENLQPWVYDHIKESVAEGPNLAGAYRLVWIPCGVNCIHVFAFDLRNGKIIWLPFTPTAGITFEKNSRLIIVNEDLIHRFEARYFVLKDNTIKEIE